MEPDGGLLASEAHAALRRAQPTAAADVLASQRRGLLPLVVIGGALLGGLAGSLGGQLAGGDAHGAMAVGLSAGAAAGMATGWPLFGLAGRLAGGRSRRPWALLAVKVTTVIPAYFVAGIGGSLATLAAGDALGRAGEAMGSALSVLTWGLIVILPLSMALAGSRRTPLVRSTRFAGAVEEVTRFEGVDDGTPVSRVGGAIISGLVWLVAGSLIVLGGLAYLAGAVPAQFAAANSTRGDLLGIAVFVAWVAVIAAGSAFTFRIFFGPRRRSGARPERKNRPGSRGGR